MLAIQLSVVIRLGIKSPIMADCTATGKGKMNHERPLEWSRSTFTESYTMEGPYPLNTLPLGRSFSAVFITRR